MSCINITPLVLSDTFNTWFERSNQSIEALNSFTIRGLSANDADGVKGFKFEDGGNCYYTVDLKTGPFIGFVTSSDDGYESGIHGTGDIVNPYNLTLKFNGTEEVLDKDEVVTADYLIVSDTDDYGLLKKTTADAFLTRLNSGTKIVVSNESDGSWTINYVPLFFASSFTDNIANYTEIGFTHTSVTYTIGIGNQSPSDPNLVPPAITQISVNSNSSSYVGNWNDLTLAGTGTTSASSLQIPNGVTWFNTNRTSLIFDASITSATASVGGFNFAAENEDRSVSVGFAWRFFGFSSTSELNVATIQSNLGSYNKNMKVLTVSQASTPGGLAHNPKTKRTLEFPTAGYNYFLHTCGPTFGNIGGVADPFGFNPIFYDVLGPISEGWATEIGTIDFVINESNTPRRYRVYRSGIQYEANNRIVVGNDTV